MTDAGAGDATENLNVNIEQSVADPSLGTSADSVKALEPSIDQITAVKANSEEAEKPPSTDTVDAPPVTTSPPEPMDTGEATKESDDGVLDVSGILKDIDDFNRSADPTPPPEPLDGEGQTTEMDAAGSAVVGEESMDTTEAPAKPAPTPGGFDEGPDTSQAIAALKSLESYDDVDSKASNEPEQFSEDIVDEDKSTEKEKESASEEKVPELDTNQTESEKPPKEDTTEKPDDTAEEKGDDSNKEDEKSESKDAAGNETDTTEPPLPESTDASQGAKTNPDADGGSQDKPKEGEETTKAETTLKTKTKKTDKKEMKSEGRPKSKGKGPQTCIVCKKVGKCKFNIVRNGDIKHLCDDNCFKVFRANPTSFLRSQSTGDDAKKPSQSNGSVAGDDDVEVVGTSKVTPRSKTKSATGTSNPCSVCGKVAVTKHEVSYSGKMHKLCSDPCFAAFRYANKLSMNNCEGCGASIASDSVLSQSIQFEGQTRKFCGTNCLNLFKGKKSKMIACVWCGTKKNNFDMVEKVEGPNKYQVFCTLNCLSLYRVNQQATSNQNVTCDHCRKAAPAQYHLTMSDASVRNFCSYGCVMAFQGQFSQPTGNPGTRQQGSGTRQSTRQARQDRAQSQGGIQISSVRSLAPQTKKAPVTNSVGTDTVIVQPPPPKDVRNKSLLCKPFTQTKATSCRPHTQTVETQTEGDPRKVIVPVPIPFYIPVPTAMYSIPQPYPLPIPVPIPVPYFIPTTKKSADSILKHIKEIQERMPADPFEAELLMMAEAVAVAEKGSDDSSDESDTETKPGEDGYGQQGGMQSGELGEDMLQMALRMAQEMPDETLDLEQSIHPSTINPETVQPVQPVEFGTIAADSDVLTALPRSQAKKRRAGPQPSNRGKNRTKRPKQEENQSDAPATPVINQPPPDANMVLKYTYGVNAWKHWVVNKNQQLQQATAGRPGRLRLFKTDILQCTADELNYSLCLFVKEVRKPNGDEYAPDSIYYLCLGIQQYLFENSRIDNIFTDIYFEKFTECLNEVLQNYEVRLNTAGLIVCRIEEEHLWESKQLGAHSPHVLLNTLIYFNTKYFMLKTPEEHLRLSFSHIMKHWKKTNMPGTKTPGRSVYLRYYAPVPNAKDAQKRKREELPVFEQAENVENPLRCPVKLYEFYLSKAPESIKNRNDVFYLIPERSCVPDSPVWYSTGNLGIEAMTKMLNRTRVVREIQEAHLHHQPMYGLH